MNHVFESTGPEATRAWAAEFAAGLPSRCLLALHGDLGAGKTCLVQGLARFTGFDGDVTSPTYVLIHEYPGRIPLVHVDLYRLADGVDPIDYGLDEYFEQDPCLIAVEWPERMGPNLPAEAWHLYLEPGPGESDRRIRVVPPGGGEV